ncbi:MAG TPA: hypothetical protein VEI01_01385 [Terriglobales bacterium]|nr:hypothetical protein [Terriglobales bacterium]
MRQKRTQALSVLLAIMLLLAGVAAAQSVNAKPKPVTLTGRVSQDGRILMADQGTNWILSNTQAVKGHEGRLVTVKCTLEPAQNRLHVLSVKGSSETRFAVNLGDSAFRR